MMILTMLRVPQYLDRSNRSSGNLIIINISGCSSSGCSESICAASDCAVEKVCHTYIPRPDIIILGE